MGRKYTMIHHLRLRPFRTLLFLGNIPRIKTLGSMPSSFQLGWNCGVAAEATKRIIQNFRLKKGDGERMLKESRRKAPDFNPGYRFISISGVLKGRRRTHGTFLRSNPICSRINRVRLLTKPCWLVGLTGLLLFTASIFAAEPTPRNPRKTFHVSGKLLSHLPRRRNGKGGREP